MDEADVREALRAVGIADVPSGIRTRRDVDRVRRTHCLAQFLRSLDARVPYVGEAVSHLNATERSCLESLFIPPDLDDVIRTPEGHDGAVWMEGDCARAR